MITGMPGQFCQLALQMFITFVELLCVIKSAQHTKYLDYLPNNSLFVVFTKKENWCLCGSLFIIFLVRSRAKKSCKQKRRFNFIWCGIMQRLCGSSKLLDVQHCSEWERVGQSALNNPWLCKECNCCLPAIIIIIVIIILINLYCSHFLKCHSVGDLPRRWGRTLL